MSGKTAAILFSGGLDSSLAVCDMIERGYNVHLLHYDTGALISNNLINIRYNELKRTYDKCIVELYERNISGLFRRIALVSLEEDIKTYGVSLICVGCKLAMHVQCIIYCKNNGIKCVADGSTERQKRYGEQREVSLEFIKEFYQEYDIEYKYPIYNLDKKEIKYGLFDRGITIQSLEDTCLFSNTFSIAEDETIGKYLDSKKVICKKLVERGLAHEKNR